MTTAIERQNPTGRKPAGLQDTAIERVLNIPHTTSCNNSKCSCIAPCTKCNLPRLNPLAIIALSRYRDDLTRLEFTREISALVDYCNVILMANQGGKL